LTQKTLGSLLEGTRLNEEDLRNLGRVKELEACDGFLRWDVPRIE
jgi:hypothetical protein